MVMLSSSTGFLFPPLSLCFSNRHPYMCFFFSWFLSSSSPLCLVLSSPAPAPPPFLFLSVSSQSASLFFSFLLTCSLLQLEVKLVLGDEDDGEADRSKLLSSSVLPLFFLLFVFCFLCIFKSFFLPLFSLCSLSFPLLLARSLLWLL